MTTNKLWPLDLLFRRYYSFAAFGHARLEVIMPALEELLQEIATHEENRDLEALRAARNNLLQEYPDCDEAAEILYKTGLDLLFFSRDQEGAIEAFKAAVAKKAPIWSGAARISLAICISRRGESSKALFELRKVAFPEAPDANSVTALAFMEYIFEESNNEDELNRVRKERISQLKSLAKEADPDFEAPVKAFYLKELALEYVRAKDLDLARKRFNEALELGEEAIGSELFAEINDLMP